MSNLSSNVDTKANVQDLTTKLLVNLSNDPLWLNELKYFFNIDSVLEIFDLGLYESYLSVNYSI